jgi:hypothetical protein
MKKQNGPPQHGPSQELVAPSTSTRRLARVRTVEEHRQRQIQRLAIVTQVQASYGLSAGGRPLPPGPQVCPKGCAYCATLVVVA